MNDDTMGEDCIVCPHCYSTDVYYAATRCPHCGGSFGNSKMRQIAVAVVIVALVVAGLVAAVNGMNKSSRNACRSVASIDGTSQNC